MLKYKKKTSSICPTDPKINKKLSEHIYNISIKNLQNDGYPVSVHFFKKLVDMEDDLVATDLKFKKRVRDSPCLLMEIIENIKAAEDAYVKPGDNQELIIRLLTQTIYMIQSHDKEYNWLLMEIYKILLKIAKRFDQEKITEALARVRFEYGCLLAAHDKHLEEAILMLETSLEKCRGTIWYTNDHDRNFLHEDCCTKLCETLLRAAEVQAKISPWSSVGFATRAAKVIKSIGTRESPSMYCFARLRQSEYLVATSKIKDALLNLKDLEKYIMSNDDPRNKCEYYYWLGCCYFKSKPQDLDTATRKFKISLNLSEEHDFTKLKAETLLNLGKIYSRDPSSHLEGRECFKQAKYLFHELKEFEIEKLTGFLMAQLRAVEIFPNYIDLIRKTGDGNYCYMFDLMQWQQRLEPFWTEDGELHEHKDNVQCVIDEHLFEHSIEENEEN